MVQILAGHPLAIRRFLRKFMLTARSLGSWRRSIVYGLISILLLVFLTIVNTVTSRADSPSGDVLAVMELLIVPASNTLWSFDSPVPIDQWTTLEKAAETVIAGADGLKDRAVGSRGVDWALEPDWQAYVAEMRKAAEDARLAAREQDLDAFETAAYAIYPPCESCHNAYNPGVIADQQ